MVADTRWTYGDLRNFPSRSSAMMYRVLVPLDGSELADQAIPWADELGGALQAEVELLRVLPLDLGAEGLEADIAFNRKLGLIKPDEAVADLHQQIVEQ